MKEYQNWFHPRRWKYNAVLAAVGLLLLIFSKNSFLLGFSSVIVLAALVYFVGLAVQKRQKTID